MNKILLSLSLGLFLSNQGIADNRAIKEPDYDRIVHSVFLAEGGNKTLYPYGIRSIKTKNKEHARRICKNTIHNNFHRWVKAGRKGTFIDFLGNRYCPTRGRNLSKSERNLNKHWKKNVLFYFQKNIKET